MSSFVSLGVAELDAAKLGVAELDTPTKEVFAKLDHDRSGEVHYHEFLAATLEAHELLNEEVLARHVRPHGPRRQRRHIERELEIFTRVAGLRRARGDAHAGGRLEAERPRRL